MKISRVSALPISHQLAPGTGPTLGVGRMVKRDAVLVKVETDDGLVGWGEAHHGRAPGAVARLIDATLGPIITGGDPLDSVGLWQRLFQAHYVTHGLGAGTAIGMSGIDLALWDIRGKAAGWPVHRLLGGAGRPIPAYAGGLTLGYQPPDSLVEEAAGYVAEGYRALKLRLGDNPAIDLARVEAVRVALGPGIDILTDVNVAYGPEQVRSLLPGLDDARVGWLEEPFAPFDHHAYRRAAGWGRTPLAAGENHYTRFDFAELMDHGAVTVLQPDLSKAGGITEVARIAALASTRRLRIHPHTSMTSLNMAASLHLLSAIDNAGYFEADACAVNPFRTELTSWQPVIDAEGRMTPPDGPGLGLTVDEDFVAAHPLVDGPCYVRASRSGRLGHDQHLEADAVLGGEVLGRRPDPSTHIRFHGGVEVVEGGEVHLGEAVVGAVDAPSGTRARVPNEPSELGIVRTQVLALERPDVGRFGPQPDQSDHTCLLPGSILALRCLHPLVTERKEPTARGDVSSEGST